MEMAKEPEWPERFAWLRAQVARLGELIDLAESVEQDWPRRFVMHLLEDDAELLRAAAERIAAAGRNPGAG